MLEGTLARVVGGIYQVERLSTREDA